MRPKILNVVMQPWQRSITNSLPLGKKSIFEIFTLKNLFLRIQKFLSEICIKCGKKLTTKQVISFIRKQTKQAMTWLFLSLNHIKHIKQC